MLRHDVRTDDFPEGSFDLVHVRAVLMHIPGRMATLRRMASWLAPGGWLVAQEADFSCGWPTSIPHGQPIRLPSEAL